MGRKIASFRYTANLTTPELGVIVIGLNAFTPLDHAAEHRDLTQRLTRAYAERDPKAYLALVERGDVVAVDPPEVHAALVAA